MRIPVRSGRFKRDVKLAEKRGKDLSRLRVLLSYRVVGDELHLARTGAHADIFDE